MKQFCFFFLVLVCTTMTGQDSVSQVQSTSMIVFSDPHFYDPSLGTRGKAFEEYLDNDRKLLRESSELLQEAIRLTLQSDVDIVLVPGDLTKDGTHVSHTGFAAQLSRLEDQGIQVFVVPGNHDILNGEANAYTGDSAQRVTNVDRHEFARIYGAYAYDEAIFLDSSSLSYVAEPVEGLWILGLDACLYEMNDSLGHSHTGGSFSLETLSWLEEILSTGEASHKTKIALMHHGILEHYKGQKKHFGEYVVENYKKVSKLLAGLGVRIVFTGHYHANDITAHQWNDGSYIIDIETGSLVTYPCPVRKILLAGDSLHIETEYIRSIPSNEEDFPAYSRSYVEEGVSGIAEKTLVDMKLRPEDAHRLAFQIGEAFSAHYAGDETPRDPPLDLEGVNLKGRFIISFRKKLVSGLYHDLPPADNKLKIHLPTGQYQ